MLSGFIFQIDSMPAVIRAVRTLFPHVISSAPCKACSSPGYSSGADSERAVFDRFGGDVFGLTWLKTKRRLD